MGTQIFDLPDGSTFEATERYVPEIPPFGGFGNDAEKLRTWVSDKWNTLFQMKRGEQERLKTCELYYAGFHYQNALDNRNNPVTNYCFSTVETVWPILTQNRPRPEPVPRRFMEAAKVRRLRDYATYKMDSSGFDRVTRLTVRDLLKFGWACPMITWDENGSSRPRYLSPFDFYPDGATDEADIETFAIAFPVATRRLRELFPDCASKIVPDNIASPGYEVYVQPYLEMASTLGSVYTPQFIGVMPSASFEDGAAATTTGVYGVDTGQHHAYGQTTFLIQLFCRDYTKMTVRYDGTKVTKSEYGDLRNPYSMHREEPCCPSGWRMVPMTASGVILHPPLPVDDSSGIPVVIGRDYEQGGRLYGRGELDDVIPIQRDINRSDAMISRALELSADPPVVTNIDSRLSVDKAGVEGGEIIRIARGSKLEYLQPQGVAESHFVRRAGRRQDVQIVAGTPDSLQGQRPIGVEAASAIRQLTETAASRARAKSNSMLEFLAVLLTKMIRSDLKKSREIIYFRASDGGDMWLNPDDYDPDDFDIRWASSTGTAQGEQDRQDQNLQLYQLGIIDDQQVLDDADYPDRQAILQRKAIRQQQQMAVAATRAGGNGGG